MEAPSIRRRARVRKPSSSGENLVLLFLGSCAGCRIDAAVEAVKQWEYTPTVLDGATVPVIMTVTVNLRLS